MKLSDVLTPLSAVMCGWFGVGMLMSHYTFHPAADGALFAVGVFIGIISFLLFKAGK